jgi:DUF4097 and DUF4098 domain-containing protein YvlB
MKLTRALMGIALAVCSPGFAQSTGERIVVPARNSARPRKVDVHLMHGNVTVKAYSGREVIVETRSGRNRDRDSERTVNGMHRIDLPPHGLTVEEEDNVITVRTRVPSSGDVMISVPADTSLTARSLNGDIDAEGLRGEFDLQSNNGHITLTNVSGSVLANSLNGPIKVSMEKVDAAKPLSFSTLNGSIEVTLPADWKANVKLNTNHGEIWTDFDFKLGGGGAITQQNSSADGRFRVTVDRNISGTVNGGGPEATFHTFNGRIYIKRR